MLLSKLINRLQMIQQELEREAGKLVDTEVWLEQEISEATLRTAAKGGESLHLVNDISAIAPHYDFFYWGCRHSRISRTGSKILCSVVITGDPDDGTDEPSGP